MVAAQLVNATPHTDAKFFATTQTMDEARHVEVFARYIEKLGQVRPIAPNLKHILDSTLETGNWLKKLVGMQIVVEGLALYSFRDMRNLTEEPLLKDLLTYVARDESRHHAYGVQYVERCVPCLSAAEHQELQDFAFEAAVGIIGSGSQAGFMTALLESWTEAGVDTAELLSCAMREREQLTGGESARQEDGARNRVCHPDAQALRAFDRKPRGALLRNPARKYQPQTAGRERRGVHATDSRPARRHGSLGARPDRMSVCRGTNFTNREEKPSSIKLPAISPKPIAQLKRNTPVAIAATRRPRPPAAASGPAPA